MSHRVSIRHAIMCGATWKAGFAYSRPSPTKPRRSGVAIRLPKPSSSGRFRTAMLSCRRKAFSTRWSFEKEMPQQKPDLMCRSYCERFWQKNSTSHWDKSAHSEIRDFYAHMALTHERHFARCFCRYSGNIAQRYFRHNKKEEAVAFTIFFVKATASCTRYKMHPYDITIKLIFSK